MNSLDIKTIFFDFGGVFTMSPFQAMLDYAKKLNADPMVLGALIFGDYGQDTDHVWHQLERGELSFIDACTAIDRQAQIQNIPLQANDFFAMFADAGFNIMREDMIKKVRLLKKQNYTLGIITNNIVEFRTEWHQLFEIDALFDHIIDSSEVGLRKPNPDIYHFALKQAQVSAEQSIFLDDLDSNLQPAAALGMHTVLVGTDSQLALRELDKLLA